MVAIVALVACEGTLGTTTPDGQPPDTEVGGDTSWDGQAMDTKVVKTDLGLPDLPAPDQKVIADKAPPPDKKVIADKALPPGLLLSDPLTGKGLIKGEKGKWVNGGKFTAKGWQATAGKSQIMIQLTTALKNPGTLKIDVTNFDPVSQNAAAKHEIINLYTQKNGSKAIFNTKGSWWNIRTGTNYLKDPMDVKFLSARNGTRTETRLKKNVTWNKSKTYTFRVSWTSTGISIYLDNQKVHTHPWGTMVEAWEYVFIGTNNVYTGQKGPIYSNLRVYNY